MKLAPFDKTLESLFENVGLSEKEAKVYKALLDLGQAKVASIVTKVSLKRGITYVTLAKLQKNGLVTSFQKDKTTYFRAESPQKLLDLTEKHEQKLSQIKDGLTHAMPSLVSQYKLTIGKPTVQFYEGEAGLRTVFKDIYGVKKDIVYGCVDLEKADEAFPKYIQNELIPLRIKNKVLAHSFVANSDQSQHIKKEDEKHLRKTVLTDKSQYPLPAEIDIYEDKIAMLSFAKGEFIGLLIENKDMAESLRSIFKLALRGPSKSLLNKDTRRKTS